MFNIGIVELLVISFFLIIFIKPQEVPKIFKQAGLLYRKLNSYVSNIKYEFSNIENIDLNKQKKSLKKTKKNKKL